MLGFVVEGGGNVTTFWVRTLTLEDVQDSSVLKYKRDDMTDYSCKLSGSLREMCKFCVYLFLLCILKL